MRLLALILSLFVGVAQADTLTSVTTYINGQLPNNNSRLITPANVRNSFQAVLDNIGTLAPIISATDISVTNLEAYNISASLVATGGLVSRTLADRFGEYPSLYDFGAKCDGTTDDTGAIISATVGSSVVRVPRATCVVGTNSITLPSSFTLVGYGSSSILSTSAVTGAIFRVTGSNNIAVRGVRFSGVTDTVVGVSVTGPATNIALTDSYADNVRLWFSTSAANTYAGTTDANSVYNVDVSRNTAIATDLGRTFGCIYSRYTNDSRFEGNYCYGYNHGLVYWGGDANGDGAIGNVRKARNLLFVGNTVRNVRNGGIWGSMGQLVDITGNNVDGGGDVGIDFEGTFDSTATGNTVRDFPGGQLATFFLNQNLVFAGNTATTSDSTYYLARINNSTGSTANKNIKFIGNSFSISGSQGRVSQNGNAENLEFTSNHFQNVRLNLDANNNAGIRANGNKMVFDFDTGVSFTALTVGRFNGTGIAHSSISDNDILATFAPAANSEGIYMTSSDFNSSPLGLVSGNRIATTTGSFTYEIRTRNGSSNGAQSANYVVRDNLLAAGNISNTQDGAKQNAVYYENNRLLTGQLLGENLVSATALDVTGTANFSSDVRVSGPLVVTSNTGGGTRLQLSRTSSPSATWVVTVASVGGGGGNGLQFQNGTTGNLDSKMVLNTSGLLIGTDLAAATSIPSATLHVSGTSSITGICATAVTCGTSQRGAQCYSTNLSSLMLCNGANSWFPTSNSSTLVSASSL